MTAWQVNLPAPGLNPLVVSLSRDDVGWIPEPQRTRAALATAIQEACTFCNDEVKREVIRTLARHKGDVPAP